MHLKELIKKGLEECMNIVFPKVCLHCKKPCDGNFFCNECLSGLDLLDEDSILSIEGDYSFFTASFESEGVAETFLREVKKLSIPVFSKVAASYMVYQYFRLKDFMPDIIIPMPEKDFGVKYNEMLAKEVSKMMQKPLKKVFFKKHIPLLSEKSFFVNKTSLSDKKALFIVDKIDEKELIAIKEKLKEFSFKSISILSFCQKSL